MFAFIRRHQTIGLFFIGLVIISFVIFFSPTAKLGGRDGGREDYGSINGEAIGHDEYVEASKEAQLAYFLRFNDWPGQDEFSRQRFDAHREAVQRLLLGRKIRELKVEVSDKALAERIAELFTDRRTGTFDIRNYEAFLKERMASAGISRADFERFLKHEVAIQHLVSVAGLAGELVTPREAEVSYRLENDQVATDVVFFSASNHLASVTIDPAAVAQFFTNREAVYRLPEQVQVTYVKFDVTNFLAEADQQMAKDTNLNQKVEQFYLQQGPEAFKDENNKALTPDAAKAKVKEQYRRSAALRLARKKANDFATELFKLPPKADNLEKLAAGMGIESKVTEPFGEFDGPKDLKAPPAFAKAAFKLTPEQPFAETPIVADDGVYIISLKLRLPSVVPDLEMIRDKVMEDYRKTQARELARRAGTVIASAVTNGLAQGKSFDAICSEFKVQPVKFPPFSLKTRSLPEVENYISLTDLGNVAFTLTPGKASGYTPGRDGGFVVYLRSRVPVAETQAKTELPAYLEELREQRKYQAFNEWFRRQVEQAQVVAPAALKKAN